MIMFMIMFMIQSLSLEFHHGINGERFSIPKSGAAGGAGEPCAGATKQLGGGLGSMARFRNNGEFLSWDFTFFFPWVTPTDGGNDSYFWVDNGAFYHPQLYLGCWEPCFPWTHLGFVMKNIQKQG